MKSKLDRAATADYNNKYQYRRNSLPLPEPDLSKCDPAQKYSIYQEQSFNELISSQQLHRMLDNHHIHNVQDFTFKKTPTYHRSQADRINKQNRIYNDNMAIDSPADLSLVQYQQHHCINQTIYNKKSVIPAESRLNVTQRHHNLPKTNKNPQTILVQRINDMIFSIQGQQSKSLKQTWRWLKGQVQQAQALNGLKNKLHKMTQAKELIRADDLQKLLQQFQQ